MATESHPDQKSLVIDDAEPLEFLITIRDGQEVVVAVDSDSDGDETAQNALRVFGAWSDLDWDEVASALDRIRHESAPTPPVDE